MLSLWRSPIEKRAMSDELKTLVVEMTDSEAAQVVGGACVDYFLKIDAVMPH